MDSERYRRRGRASLRRRWGIPQAVLAVAAVALLAACERAVVTGATAAGELEWRERQTLFRVLPEPLRLEAYGLRGGVVQLGSVRLPAGVCPRGLVLDAGAGRLWLRHERGSIELDARSLRIVAAEANAPEPSVTLVTQALDGAVCGAGRAWAQSSQPR